MFCQKCGNQLDDDEKFCHVCGTPSQPVQAPAPQQTQQAATLQTETAAATTNYASTSFKCALWGAALFLCGVGLLAEPFALLFGVLALKNGEPEKTKAWIGAIIGAAGTILLMFVIYAFICGFRNG